MRKNTFDFINKRLIFIIMIIFPCALFPESFSGKYMCVGVSDGDTILIMNEGKEIKIKIDGIDCPEMGQDFGKKAKQFTSDLLFGKIVEVNIKGVDKYGTTIAYVLVEKKDVGLELIKAGLAWNYKQYSSDDPIYTLAEQDARNAKKELWSMANPISPWDFRNNAFKLIENKSQNVSSIPSVKTQPSQQPVTSTSLSIVQNLESQPTINEKENQPSVAEYYDEKHKKGLERFEEEVQELAKKADEMDIAYTRYNDACFNKYTSGNFDRGYSGKARGRGWFFVWGGGFSGNISIDNESTVECRKIWSDFLRLARGIKAGMESAMEYARKAAVLPGQLRDVRERYLLDWSGWD